MTTPYASESRTNPERCNWCEGEGVRPYTWAYVPGNDPFRFRDAVTHTRMGNCRNCRGTGIYSARRDPTIPAEDDTDPGPGPGPGSGDDG